jgi:hypothetical protein
MSLGRGIDRIADDAQDVRHDAGEDAQVEGPRQGKDQPY